MLMAGPRPASHWQAGHDLPGAHPPQGHLPALLQILMPGHLMCKFMKERLEESQNTFRDMVRRELDKAPEGVNLQVGGSVRAAV